MTPSTLQGLDIIHPAQQQSTEDSRNLLLGQVYPDLAAQLDLWSHLDFESDEHDSVRKNSLRALTEEQEEQVPRSPLTEETANRDGHANVVNPINQLQNQNISNPSPVIPTAVTAQPLDLSTILTAFGLDSFTAAAIAATATASIAPPHNQQPQLDPSPQQSAAPSLAQLLALQAINGVAHPTTGLLAYPSSAVPPTIASDTSLVIPNSEDSYGSTTNPRTRRPSLTTRSSEDGSPTPNSGSPVPTHTSPSVHSPLSPAEDKRRRNTAASARFRMKKKEREAALETKAKDLEGRVVDLERECESLRRENGWLKGLVVGVTGAAPNGQTLSHSQSIGTKRLREEVES